MKNTTITEGKLSDFIKKIKDIYDKGILNIAPKELGQRTYMLYRKYKLDVQNKDVKAFIDTRLGDAAQKEFYRLLKTGPEGLKETTMKLTKAQLREIIKEELLREAAPKLKPKMYIMVKNTRTGEEHVVAGFTGAGDAHIALPAFTKIAPAHLEYRVYSGK